MEYPIWYLWNTLKRYRTGTEWNKLFISTAWSDKPSLCQPSKIFVSPLPFSWFSYTVYPKKYAHSFCFAVLCCGYTLTDFPISIRLTSLALWHSNDCPSASKATLMNMDKYFMWIHYERLHNRNKAKHNKTVCIFLGIYCIMISLYARTPRNKTMHSISDLQLLVLSVCEFPPKWDISQCQNVYSNLFIHRFMFQLTATNWTELLRPDIEITT